jgi:hypothetical protein
MKVKLKDPKRVYFDRETQTTFYGPKPIETKVTGFVRAQLNAGAFVEVESAKPAEKEKAPAKAEKETAPAKAAAKTEK